MQRPRLEQAFLPASLELQSTPPSPVGRWLLWSLLLLLVTVLGWSCWARMDIVATAGGKLVPRGQVKVVQAFVPGVVERLHVRDGDRVARGDLLVEFDDTEATARIRQVENALEAARSRSARLARLGDFIAHGPDATTRGTGLGDIVENDLLHRERVQHASRLEQFSGQRRQHEQELATTVARANGLRGIHGLVSQRSAALEKLTTVGHVSTEAWLKVAQEQRTVETELAVLEGQRMTLLSAIDKLDRDRDAYLAERLREVTDAALAAQREQAGLEEELSTARLHLARHRLSAPVAGRVQQLAMHTVGGVVMPAQELLRIVPADDELEVEALVLNRDIGEVRAGMPAVVKLQAYPFTRFGTLPAEVVSLSADAISDPSLGLVYKARVRLSGEATGTRERMRLEPGMAASIEVRIGERRVIELLINPLLRAVKEAGRER